MGKAVSLISPETALLLEDEAGIFLKSVALGLFLSVVITFISSLKNALNCRKTGSFIFDFLSVFFIFPAVFFFSLKENFGIIRYFIAAGVLSGIYAGRKTVCIFFYKIFCFFLKPLQFVSKCIRRHEKDSSLKKDN